MPFAILFGERTEKELKKLDVQIQERIKKEISALAENSEKGKHLSHCPFWSLRIGKYRAIYEIDKNENKVIVLFIGHRKDVYEDFNLLV
jgi:mRNA interferase RelE/StbE